MLQNALKFPLVAGFASGLADSSTPKQILLMDLQPLLTLAPSTFNEIYQNALLLSTIANTSTLISNDGGLEYWPKDRPLPYPRWKLEQEDGCGNRQLITTTTTNIKSAGEIVANKSPTNSNSSIIHFGDVIKYEHFAGIIELVSQQTVSGHKYNTIDNFIRFYRAYKKSKIDTLKDFYREYQPPITPCHYTCVGLAYELLHRIHHVLPKEHSATNKFYIVSCEEFIETIETYTKSAPPNQKVVEKEHVLVCLPIQIGQRKGYLLLDPGYHVSRVVTVMEDGLYPHTGRFVQCDEGSTRKEYEYILQSKDYVAWNVTEIKKGISECYTNLIFVGKPFLSAIDVAERRNLVYEFKSLLKRDAKGRILAGIYFILDEKSPKLTLFFMENNNRRTIKLNVVKNFKDLPEIRECEFQLGLKKGRLIQKLNTIGRIINDDGFLTESTVLNNEIMTISAEN